MLPGCCSRRGAAGSGSRRLAGRRLEGGWPSGGAAATTRQRCGRATPLRSGRAAMPAPGRPTLRAWQRSMVGGKSAGCLGCPAAGASDSGHGWSGGSGGGGGGGWAATLSLAAIGKSFECGVATARQACGGCQELLGAAPAARGSPSCTRSRQRHLRGCRALKQVAVVDSNKLHLLGTPRALRPVLVELWWSGAGPRWLQLVAWWLASLVHWLLGAQEAGVGLPCWAACCAPPLP